MTRTPQPLDAADALASQYRDPHAKRMVYRAAAAVRLQFAGEADDPLKELQLVSRYEQKEAAI